MKIELTDREAEWLEALLNWHECDVGEGILEKMRESKEEAAERQRRSE